MKTKQIEMTVYETGDVLDISDTVFRFQDGRENALPHSIKAKARANSTGRMLVISCIETKDGFLYKGFMNNGRAISLKHNEMGTEKYVGHIDLRMLFAEDDGK